MLEVTITSTLGRGWMQIVRRVIVLPGARVENNKGFGIGLGSYYRCIMDVASDEVPNKMVTERLMKRSIPKQSDLSDDAVSVASAALPLSVYEALIFEEFWTSVAVADNSTTATDWKMARRDEKESMAQVVSLRIKEWNG
ncbi:hypothetical protein BDZ97DRAFT_1753770 [Flammula alnicola]|nr:hypothetical protein BDZ97DRAFT_1753770 [Flammula alnicola]